jgi:hypothetical protein
MPRYEVGLNLSDIRTFCIGSPQCPIPSFGLGGGATANLTRNLSVDFNLNVTPSQSNGQSNQYGGHIAEYLIGPRAEIRGRHYGYFVEAQPGIFHWSHAITGTVFTTPNSFTFQFGGITRFVSNVGAGFEYSPSAHIQVRGEVADLIMRYSSQNWTNNLQPTIGVYYGFGKPIDFKPPVYNTRATHAFFGPSNDVLLAGSLLAITADSITTQRFISRGFKEGDPIARPLVKYGWSGQISLMAIEFGAETLGMYGLHRIGHHWIERAIPVGVATAHGIFAYNNTKASEHKTSSTTP